MERNWNDPIDTPRPNARFVRHPGTERMTELTAIFIFEAPNRDGDGPTVFEHGAGAVIALYQRVTGTTEGPLSGIGDTVAGRTTAWSDEIQQPGDDRPHALVSTGRDWRCG